MPTDKNRDKTGKQKPAPTAGGKTAKSRVKLHNSAAAKQKPAGKSGVKVHDKTAGKPPAAAPPVPGGNTAKPSNFSDHTEALAAAGRINRSLIAQDRRSDSGGHDPNRPVGPGNPPRSTQFRPGKSGNPKGYPKGQKNAATIIKYWLAQESALENPLSGKIENLSQLDITTLALIKEARKGHVGAFRELLDRVEGKPVQSTKLLGIKDKQLNIVVGFAPTQPPPPQTPNKK